MKKRQPKGKNTLASQLKNIAKGVEGLTTMNESLEITRFVPTIFPSFNRAIVLGGAPLGCVWTVHGEYSGGKSTFCVGMIRSFTEQGHLAAFIDAEYAADRRWFENLGVEPASFLFYRPETMEDMSDMVDQLIANFDAGRKDGTIPSDKGMIIVIDSVNKLTPKSEYARFKKEGADALDKGLSRYRGLLLQTWLDRMTPIVGSRNIALVCIAQEREVKPDKMYDPDFKVKGCQGMLFDASVQIRILKGSKEWLEFGKGKQKKKRLVGLSHNMAVIKNKVGFPSEFGRYYTSNGKGSMPSGFNLPKTYIEEDKYRAKSRPGWKRIAPSSGAWFEFNGYKFNGEAAFIEALQEDPDMLNDFAIELNDTAPAYLSGRETE